MRTVVGGICLNLMLAGPLWSQADPCKDYGSGQMRTLVDSVAPDDSTLRLPGGSKARCFTVAVTITSTMTTLVSTGTVLSATGTSAFQVTLGPGSIQDAEFDFASHPEGVTAPMVWSEVTASGGPCTITATPGKPSEWNFWLGMTFGPKAKAGLVAGPDETDLQNLVVSCNNRNTRKQQPVFAPAWTVAHGEGEDGESGSAQSSAEVMGMMGGMSGMMANAKEAEKIQKQLEKGEISEQEAGKRMQAMLGGGIADKAAAAADNFMITMSGDATPGRSLFAHHVIDRTVPMEGGQGTVREHTVIEIVHVSSRKP
jgi:hypothetical protein